MLNFENAFHSLHTSPLLDMWFTDVFYQTVNCFFILLTWSFAAQVLNFDEDDSVLNNERIYFCIFVSDLKNFKLGKLPAPPSPFLS